jgi:hypothetical protein
MTDDLGWTGPSDTGSGESDVLAALVNGDERRLQVRAYRFWTSLQAGRALPLIADLDRAPQPEFAANAILVDVTGPTPEICFLGHNLQAEAGLADSDLALSQIPARSLISRLTDRSAQVIHSRFALGFEAEFVNHRGVDTLYRGLLLPFSQDGTAVDFIYGVINWKEVARTAPGNGVAPDAAAALAGLLRTRGARILWREAPVAEWLRRGPRAGSSFPKGT